MDALAAPVPHKVPPDPALPLAHEELEALFARDAVRVRRLVRLNVTAPDAAIEDACQVAWMRLVSDPTRVSAAGATGWLVRVAIREAMRGARRAARDLSLDELVEQRGPGVQPAAAAADEVAEQRHRLGAIDRLPERQRRLVWLRGLGFSYREMAGETGDSVRTVERQLDKARLRLEQSGAV